jgi:DNA-binding beta-propeller fold protein YncE
MSRTRRALATTLVALALGGVTSAPGASAAEIPDHPIRGSITGEKIGPKEQFKDACGVALDSAGDIYVADYYQNRIVVFDDEEKYLTQIRGVDPLDVGGVAPLDGPCDLAVDSAGRVYVNDYHQDVVRFTPDEYPPQPPVPPALLGTAYSSKLMIDDANSTGVAVDPKTDRVYVDDRTHVAVYEPSGAPVMEGAQPLLIGAGSLLDGYSVAISAFPATEGLVYAADASTETIKVYDPVKDPEQPQFEIRGEGTDQGHFNLVDTDLAVDPEDGHLYVSQNLEPNFEFTPEAVVDEFSPEGFYRGPVPRTFANGFDSFLQAGEPTGLAISEGNLYVTSGNYENAAVYIFGPPAPFDPKLLTVEKTGAGEGSVTSLPAAISCEPVCKAQFNKGTNVLLRASAVPGSAFVAWSGCDEEPSPGRCTVRMEAAHTVSAEFAPEPQPAAAPLAASAARSTITIERPPDNERSSSDLGAAAHGCAHHPRRRRGHPKRPPARRHAGRSGTKGVAAHGCRAGGRLTRGRSLNN